MRYKLGMSIQAEVVDDRLKQTVDAAQKELQEQASAYVDVVLRDRLIEKLTKRFGGYGMAAQFAQAAVDVLVEELKHTSILLPGVQAHLVETKDVDNGAMQLPPGKYNATIVDVKMLPAPKKPGRKPKPKG